MVDYVSSTEPSNPSEYETWLNPDDDIVRVYDGTKWIETVEMYQEVKRDVTGDVLYNNIASGLTATTTTTSATVSTATTATGMIQFTKMSATATGGFTTATIALLRNGSTLTTTTGGTGTTLVTSNTTSLTGTNTFTGQLHLTAGTPGTLTFTAKREDRFSLEAV